MSAKCGTSHDGVCGYAFRWIALAAFLLFAWPWAQCTDRPAAAPSTDAFRVQNVMAGMPLLFEPNVGQDDSQVGFLSRGRGYTLHLSSNQAVFALHRRAHDKFSSPPTASASLLRMNLAGANPAARGEALDPAPAKTFYYVGSDRSKWRTSIPNYQRVKYSSVYPGVDVAYYANQGKLEYDFIVNPGASVKPIRLAVDDAWVTRIDADGELILISQSGEIRWRKPLADQEIDGRRRLVAARFALHGKHQFGFEVAARRRGALRERLVAP
jgi:hypothetical protein